MNTKRTRGCSLAVCALWWAGVAACAQDVEGESRPTGFYYPIDVQVSPSGKLAYVVSSNFDHRFTTGWISMVDLEKVAARASEDPFVIDAEIIPRQINVPSIAGPLALEPGPSPRFGILAHRGERVITIVEVDADGLLSCGGEETGAGLDSQGQRTDCDERHLFRLDSTANLSAAEWGTTIVGGALNDPFAVAVFAVDSEVWAAVSFLTRDPETQGLVLLYNVNLDGDPMLEPRVRVPLGTGNLDTSGASAIAVRPPEATDPTAVRLAVGSRKVRRDDRNSTVYDLDVRAAQAAPFSYVAGTHSVSNDVGPLSSGIAADIAGLTFVPAGTQAGAPGGLLLAANRAPDGVAALDASLAPAESATSAPSAPPARTPRYDVLTFAPIEGAPSGVTYLAGAAGQSDLVATFSLDTGSVHLMRLRGAQLVTNQRLTGVGSGPFAAAAVARPGGTGTSRWLLTATFYDHGLSIIDVPAAETGARLLLQIRDPDLGSAAR